MGRFSGWEWYDGRSRSFYLDFQDLSRGEFQFLITMALQSASIPPIN